MTYPFYSFPLQKGAVTLLHFNRIIYNIYYLFAVQYFIHCCHPKKNVFLFILILIFVFIVLHAKCC